MADMFESTKVVPEKPPVDIVTNNGKVVESESGRMLNDIFSLAEQGKPIDEAIKASMEKPAPAPKDVVEEEPKVEVKSVEAASLDAKLTETQDAKTEEEEVSREALLAKTAPKKVEPKIEAKEEPKQEVKAEEPSTDPDAPKEDELQVLPHDKPKTAKRIQALWTKAKKLEETVATTRKEADERANKLAELEKQLSAVKSVNPETDAAVKAKLDELAMFRRRYELDKDPEVKTKFDSRVQYAEKNITDILTARQATPALLKLIADEGGWSKFANSQTPIAVRGADGQNTTIPASEAAENIMSALPMLERKQLEAAMMEQIQLDREKKRFLEEETKRAVDYFKTRDEEAVKQTEAQQKGMEEAKKLIEEFKATAVTQREWLKPEDVPAGATPEQEAEIKESNSYKKQLASLLHKNLNVKDIPSMLGVVEDSVAYYAERRRTAKLMDENARLKAEVASKDEAMAKFKNASRTTVKSGSIAGGGSASSAPKKAALPASLDEALARIESGEKVIGE